MYSLGVSTDYTAEKGIRGGLANQDAQTVTPTSICDSKQFDDIDIGAWFVVSAVQDFFSKPTVRTHLGFDEAKTLYMETIEALPVKIHKIKEERVGFPVMSTKCDHSSFLKDFLLGSAKKLHRTDLQIFRLTCRRIF